MAEMIHGALGMGRSPWKSINGLREAHSGWQRQVAGITMRSAIYPQKLTTLSDSGLPIIKEQSLLESAMLEILQKDFLQLRHRIIFKKHFDTN